MSTTTGDKVATPYPDDRPDGVHECANCGTRIDVVLLDDQPGTAGWVHDHNGLAAYFDAGERELVALRLSAIHDAATLVAALSYRIASNDR